MSDATPPRAGARGAQGDARFRRARSRGWRPAAAARATLLRSATGSPPRRRCKRELARRARSAAAARKPAAAVSAVTASLVERPDAAPWSIRRRSTHPRAAISATATIPTLDALARRRRRTAAARSPRSRPLSRGDRRFVAQDPPQRRARLSCRSRRPGTPTALMAPDSGFTHRQTLAGVVRFNSPELHEEAGRVVEAGGARARCRGRARRGTDRAGGCRRVGRSPPPPTPSRGSTSQQRHAQRAAEGGWTRAAADRPAVPGDRCRPPPGGRTRARRGRRALRRQRPQRSAPPTGCG